MMDEEVIAVAKMYGAHLYRHKDGSWGWKHADKRTSSRYTTQTDAIQAAREYFLLRAEQCDT